MHLAWHTVEHTLCMSPKTWCLQIHSLGRPRWGWWSADWQLQPATGRSRAAWVKGRSNFGGIIPNKAPDRNFITHSDRIGVWYYMPKIGVWLVYPMVQCYHIYIICTTHTTGSSYGSLDFWIIIILSQKNICLDENATVGYYFWLWTIITNAMSDISAIGRCLILQNIWHCNGRTHEEVLNVQCQYMVVPHWSPEFYCRLGHDQ